MPCSTGSRPVPGRSAEKAPAGRYYVARMRGLDVAGIASQPAPEIPTAWLTSIAVDNVDASAEAVVACGRHRARRPL